MQKPSAPPLVVVAQPVDDVGELTELLTAAKLLKHAAAIEKAGYAEPDDLRAAEDEDLLEVGIRKPEIKRLRKYLSDATAAAAESGIISRRIESATSTEHCDG